MYDSPRLYVCQKHGRAFVLSMFLMVRKHGALMLVRFVFNQSGCTRVAFVLANRASIFVHSQCSICTTGSSCLPLRIVLSVKRCAGDRWDGYLLLVFIVPDTVLELT